MRRILCIGGHDFGTRPGDRGMTDLIASLARERAGGEGGDQVGEGAVLGAGGEVMAADAEDASHQAARAPGRPTRLGVGGLSPR